MRAKSHLEMKVDWQKVRNIFSSCFSVTAANLFYILKYFLSHKTIKRPSSTLQDDKPLTTTDRIKVSSKPDEKEGTQFTLEIHGLFVQLCFRGAWLDSWDLHTLVRSKKVCHFRRCFRLCAIISVNFHFHSFIPEFQDRKKKTRENTLAHSRTRKAETSNR